MFIRDHRSQRTRGLIKASIFYYSFGEVFVQPVPTPLARDSAHVLVRVILHLDRCLSPPVGPSQLSAQPPANRGAFLPRPPSQIPPILQSPAWISRKPSRLGPGLLPAWQCFSLSAVRLHHWVALNSVFGCYCCCCCCCDFCCRNIASPP